MGEETTLYVNICDFDFGVSICSACLHDKERNGGSQSFPHVKRVVASSLTERFAFIVRYAQPIVVVKMIKMFSFPWSKGILLTRKKAQ